MLKISTSDSKLLVKNFKGVFEKSLGISPRIILFPLSFIFFIILGLLCFVKNIIAVLFSYLPDSKHDPTPCRVAGLIVFGYLFVAKFMILGALSVPIYIIGIFYDFTNKILCYGEYESILKYEEEIVATEKEEA